MPSPRRNSAASAGSKAEPVPHVSGPAGRPPTAALYYRPAVGCRCASMVGRGRSSEAIYPLKKVKKIKLNIHRDMTGSPADATGGRQLRNKMYKIFLFSSQFV